MSQSNKPPLKSVTVRLYEGDTEELSRFFPRQGYNMIIREKVHQLVRALQTREQEQLDAMIETNSSETKGQSHDFNLNEPDAGTDQPSDN
jgi:hypothetical protein